MSTDMVDNLHAAEDRIGFVTHTLATLVTAINEHKPSVLRADLDPLASALSSARAIIADPWCRPECEEHNHFDLDDSNASDCGCPAHPDPDTREWRIGYVVREFFDDEETASSHGVDVDTLADRFLLVERNVKGSEPPFWLTTHESPEMAGEYHHGQEYAEDWAIVELVDLDTGARFYESHSSVAWAPSTTTTGVKA